MNSVCFVKSSFYTYLFILVCVISYLVYFFKHSQDKYMSKVTMYNDMNRDTLLQTLTQTQNELYNAKLNEQKSQHSLQTLQALQQTNTQSNITSRLIEKIYNPLISPESIYSNGRVSNGIFDGYQQYQMLGYLSGGVGKQYPVFGRYKYPGKSDKYEYYTISDDRNRIKIIIQTKNYNELFSGDKIMVPQISSQELVFTKYEVESVRYNPNF